MLQTKVLISIMEGLLDFVGLSGDEIEEKLSNDQYDPHGDNVRIKQIAETIPYKIVAVEFLQRETGLFGSNVGVETVEFGIVYDDEIEVDFEENFDIVQTEFLMNRI